MICCNCDGTKTHIERKYGRVYERWMHDENGNILCKRCYNYLIGNIRSAEARRRYQRKYKAEIKSKTLTYKGKAITFPFDILCGVCNWCRRVLGIDTKRTNRHHDEGKYNDADPLWNTIEICAECHMPETLRLKQIKGNQFIQWNA